MDDDFVLPPRWIAKIVEGFRTYPDVAFVSGKVLPLWQSEVPAWMGPEHWSALALADYGGESFFADRARQVCLLACSFRRADVDAVGGYRFSLGVSNDLIGGVEDLDLLQRLWQAGKREVYLPGIAFQHKVSPSRVTRSYHRRWHTGHGRFYAKMRDTDFERSRARFFDVPVHMYRQAASAAAEWLKWKLLRRDSEAFLCETRLRFFLGFFRERRQASSSAV